MMIIIIIVVVVVVVVVVIVNFSLKDYNRQSPVVTRKRRRQSEDNCKRTWLKEFEHRANK